MHRSPKTKFRPVIGVLALEANGTDGVNGSVRRIGDFNWDNGARLFFAADDGVLSSKYFFAVVVKAWWIRGRPGVLAFKLFFGVLRGIFFRTVPGGIISEVVHSTGACGN